MSIVLQIARRVYEDMVAHARAELPNECCGLLAGQILPGRAVVTARYALVNAAASPVRYDADPKSLFAAFKEMRALGTELLAIYHSHPTSDPVPSRTDLERNFYGPEVVHLIVSLRTAEPEVRGWRLHENGYTEAAWEVAG
jgi:proteasome lid subunit RPN8/RPN11